MKLLNKENYKDQTEVYKLLKLFEVAHNNQDGFHMSVVLTKLKHYNVKIVPLANETDQPLRLKSNSESRCPLMDI